MSFKAKPSIGKHFISANSNPTDIQQSKQYIAKTAVSETILEFVPGKPWKVNVSLLFPIRTYFAIYYMYCRDRDGKKMPRMIVHQYVNVSLKLTIKSVVLMSIRRYRPLVQRHKSGNLQRKIGTFLKIKFYLEGKNLHILLRHIEYD